MRSCDVVWDREISRTVPPRRAEAPRVSGRMRVDTSKHGVLYNQREAQTRRTGLMYQKLSQPRMAAGFTLIEIIVVAVVISILSAIGIISVQSFMGRARIRVVLGETYQIASAMSFARE